MKKLSQLFAILVLSTTAVFSQQNTRKAFQIDGEINADTGTVKLFLIGDSSNYPESARHYQAQIINRKFTITGEIQNPTAYTLRLDNRSASDVVVIEAGKQRIKWDISIMNDSPQTDNLVMKEQAQYKISTRDFRKRSDLFDEEYKALRRKYQDKLPMEVRLENDAKRQAIYDEGDQQLLKFVTDNPGSYWALWRLVHLTAFGYEKIFDQIITRFSDDIQNSYTGKQLAAFIKKSGMLSAGKTFPEIDLLTISGKKTAGISFSKNKYTLVDFWYTNCGPCLARFPFYIPIYDQYKNKGFEISCIATDALKYQKDLPVAIKKHHLKWSHYWDKNGTVATELGVLVFPTNYLVDSEGRIIQKNITAAQLALFLKNNI